MINSNIIQRNIMLLGDVEDIKNIIVERKDNDINIYKCCLLDTYDKDIIKK